MAGHAYREKMGQVGMIVSAVLFPLSLMSMLLGMNVAELNPGALTSISSASVWIPLLLSYAAYLGGLAFVLFRR